MGDQLIAVIDHDLVIVVYLNCVELDCVNLHLRTHSTPHTLPPDSPLFCLASCGGGTAGSRSSASKVTKSAHSEANGRVGQPVDGERLRDHGGFHAANKIQGAARAAVGLPAQEF